jgi:Transcriptional regulator
VDRWEDTMAKWLAELEHEEEMTDKQRAILRAAVKLFSEKGFHASSTSEIAKEAGVAEGTIFRHYKTKKDILLAVVVPLLVKFLSPRMLRDVQAIFGDPSLSTEETLRRVYKNRLELVEQNWDRFRILLQEAAFHPEIREAIIEHIAKRARALMTAFVEKKIRDGEFRNLPPAVIVRVGFSLLAGYVFFKHIAFPDEGIKLDDEEEIALMVDILLHGVRNPHRRDEEE